VLVGTHDADIRQWRADAKGVGGQECILAEQGRQRLLRFQALDKIGSEKPLTERTLRVGIHQQHALARLSKGAGQVKADGTGGLLALALAQPEPQIEFQATPHFCLRELGLISPDSKGGKSYRLFRDALRRLAAVRYQNERFYDPVRREHREVTFGLFSYLRRSSWTTSSTLPAENGRRPIGFGSFAKRSNDAAPTMLGGCGRWQEQGIFPDAPPGFDAFVLDHQVGRFVQLLVSRCCAPDSLRQFAEASGEVSKSPDVDSPAGRILASSLRGVREALEIGRTDALERAYAEALGIGARHVARDLCWFWCFRYSTGRQIYEADLAVWHWRFVWLTLEIGGTDDLFYAGVREQELAFWSHLAQALQLELPRTISAVFAARADSPRDLLQRLHNVLAESAVKVMGVRRAVSEVAKQLSLAQRMDAFDALRPQLVLSLAEMVFSPVGSSFVGELRNDVDTLAFGAWTPTPS
jgi:hypothetical protein